VHVEGGDGLTLDQRVKPVTREDGVDIEPVAVELVEGPTESDEMGQQPEFVGGEGSKTPVPPRPGSPC